MTKLDEVRKLKRFLTSTPPAAGTLGQAVSMFSGAGVSDAGYALAGFEFAVQLELDARRAAIGRANFPRSTWIVGNAQEKAEEVVRAYQAKTTERLALLVATPPCQGMSSSNPSRGKRSANSVEANEAKNKLILTLTPVALALRPRVIVAENVRPILTLHATHRGRRGRVVDHLRAELPDYTFFEGVIDVADYGVPQTRKRAVVVGVHKEEGWLDELLARRLAPWPHPTHQEGLGTKYPWVTIREWLEFMKYPSLDAREKVTARGTVDAKGNLDLHEVPHYENQPDRYKQISEIPSYSGRSAYQNEVCPSCRSNEVPLNVAVCPACGATLINRPYVRDEKGVRLIRGFASSYRRMHADRPASTVTTNSSHVGSDYKIHPWEHRVMSTLEVADLQTVPRYFDWSYTRKHGLRYTVRNVVGEAFPAYFTYLHGQTLAPLLNGGWVDGERLSQDGRCESRSLEEVTTT